MPDVHTLRLELRADCSRCVGLCCVAPSFGKSADFAISKRAGQPCPNLKTDHRCGIHNHLQASGFRGCTTFDCFGSGQAITNGAFAGRSWQDDDSTAADMFSAFSTLRAVHEMLWYLLDVQPRLTAGPLLDEVDEAVREVADLAAEDEGGLDAIDAVGLMAGYGPLLVRASQVVRAGIRSDPADHYRADLAGTAMRGRDLRAANLCSASLLGADLRDADLRHADVLGADLRGARVAGADFRDCLFLTQMQVSGMNGDAETRIWPEFDRPALWKGRSAASAG